MADKNGEVSNITLRLIALVVRIREVAVVGNCGFTALRYISGQTEHGQSYCSSANLMEAV